jgi:hypothetical protein
MATVRRARVDRKAVVGSAKAAAGCVWRLVRDAYGRLYRVDTRTGERKPYEQLRDA